MGYTRQLLPRSLFRPTGFGTHRFIQLLPLVCLNVLSLEWTGWGCGYATEKSIRYGVSAHRTSDSFDPVDAGDSYHTMVVTAIYDTLFEYKYLKRPFTLKGNIAEYPPTVSPNGLTYTIRIKPGITFQDDPCFPEGKGREVQASDFVYSLKRYYRTHHSLNQLQNKILGLGKWAQNGAKLQDPIEGLKAEGPYQIKIVLNTPFPNLEHLLAMTFTAVVPQEAVDFYGPQFRYHPVGSNAFLLDAYSKDRVVLKRNPKYRKQTFDAIDDGYDPELHMDESLLRLSGRQLPFLDSIELVYESSGNQRWQMLTSENSLHYSLVPTDRWGTVPQNQTAVRIEPVSAPSILYFAFNMQSPTVGYHRDRERNRKNKQLRCAIRGAFPWKQLIEDEYKGQGNLFPGMIPEQIRGFDPNLSKVSVMTHIAESRATIKQIFPNPRDLPTIEYPGVESVSLHRDFYHFKRSLMEIGFPDSKVVVKPYSDFNVLKRSILSQKHNFIAGFHWVIDYPDAENILQLFYNPSMAPKGNFTGFMNPEFNETFEKIISMGHSPQRNLLVRRANEILIDECVVISGICDQQMHAWHSSLVMYPYSGVITNIFKYIDRV